MEDLHAKPHQGGDSRGGQGGQAGRAGAACVNARTFYDRVVQYLGAPGEPERKHLVRTLCAHVRVPGGQVGGHAIHNHLYGRQASGG